MLKRACAAVSVSAMMCVLALNVARAQDYPTRTVTIVVPYAPGGGTDQMGRIIAEQLSEDTKQQFVVENKLGASGILGAQFVSTSKPDGYTLVYTSGITMATVPAMLKNSTFDMVRDMTPIAQTVVGPEVFAVNPKLGIKNFADLVAYLKKGGGGFKWSIGGIGSLEQLTIAALDKQLGVKSLIVPYDGVGLGVVAAMGGEVDGALAPLPALKPPIGSGALIGLAVTSGEKIAELPNIPTVGSVGYPDLESYNWNGIWGPKQMPKALVQTIHDEIVKALTMPAARTRIAAGGFEVPTTALTPDQFAAYMKSEVAKYDPILADLGLKGIQ